MINVNSLLQLHSLHIRKSLPSMEENFQRDFSEVFKNAVIEMFSASNEYVYQNDLMHYFYGTSQYSTLFTLENPLP